MTDPLDAQERARLFTARWALDPCERKHMTDDFAEQIRQAEQAARKKALIVEVPEEWPVWGPEFNQWNEDAALFVRLLQNHPNMWHKNTQLKYLEMRIDTREGGRFLLFDRDKNKISADVVLYAIRALSEET